MSGSTNHGQEAHEESLLDVQGVATRLGVTVKTIYCMRERGAAPPAVRIGSRLRWDRRDLEQWILEQREAS